MSQAVDQQVNLYLLEIKDAIWTAVATQGRLVNIWQNYNIYYEGYKNLYVMYESKKKHHWKYRYGYWTKERQNNNFKYD